MKLWADSMASDLPILNAELYAGVHLIGEIGKAKNARAAQGDDGPRKRARKSPVRVIEARGLDDGGEKAKRGRGRPKLDTKDQSATERRRTQIRMAQRAYRSRKENTIQTLENQVEDLKKTNQEMTNAFVKLHDYAVDHGIDNMAPGFAQELKFMMDKFLSLARNSREATGEGSLDHESGDPEKLPQGHSEMHSSPETLDTPPSSKTTSSVLGYNFTHEIEIDPALSLDALRMPVERPYATTQTPPTYETVTMPTLENASFPFGTSTDTTFLDLFTDTSGAQATSTPTISPPLLSPFLSSLPAPASFAFNEISFGRRLQRSALQTGYRLITMPNPPADELARSFGFVLLFEPVDKIRERLRRGLEKTSAESLNYWPAPFWALGGAGQRSFGGSADGSATGNVGTEDVGKHDFDSTLGIGPFDIKTTDARDRRVDGRMRITLPGFEGEFFDPDEVEVYLRSRGVAIPPGQDYVTVEVDAHWLEEGRQGQTGVEQWAALSPDSGSTSLSEAPTTAVDDGSWATGTGLGGGGIFGDTASFSTSSGTSAAGKKLVTLDIDKFVRELVARGVCLGRSPGFRPKDVSRAFWKATRSDGTLWF